MEWLVDFVIFIFGMFTTGAVWFINDKGKNSPYLRGFRDGYDVAKIEMKDLVNDGGND